MGGAKLSQRSIDILKKSANGGNQEAIQALKDAGIDYTPQLLSTHSKEVLWNSGQAFMIPTIENIPNIISPHAADVLKQAGLPTPPYIPPTYTDPTIPVMTGEGPVGDEGGGTPNPVDPVIPPIVPPEDGEETDFEKYLRYLSELASSQAETDTQAGYVAEYVKQRSQFTKIEMLAIKTGSMLLLNLSDKPIDQLIEIFTHLRDQLRMKYLLKEFEKEEQKKNGKLVQRKKKRKQLQKKQRGPKYKKGKEW